MQCGETIGIFPWYMYVYTYNTESSISHVHCLCDQDVLALADRPRPRPCPRLVLRDFGGLGGGTLSSSEELLNATGRTVVPGFGTDGSGVVMSLQLSAVKGRISL